MKKSPEVPHCPICNKDVNEKIRLSKTDPVPAFDRTEDCHNEWFIHVSDKLYLITHPKLYKVA